MAFEEGPYIQAACFCDMVIEDKQGVLSLIRVIDTLTHSAAGPSPPKEMPLVTAMLKLVLMLKSGRARGRYELKIVPEKPSGETLKPIGRSVYFEGEEKGYNIILNMHLKFEQEGLYWFKIYLDEDKLTVLPFRVKYSRTVRPELPQSR